MYPSFLFLLIAFLLNDARADSPAKRERVDCGAVKEFITLHSYLRKDPEDRAKESDALETAQKAAKGCSGAAHRMIRVSKTLGIAGVNRKNRMEIGMEFALRDTATTEAFIGVFRMASAEDVLDLDLDSALRLARSLSIEFKGDPTRALQDFERVLKWCSDATRSGLTRKDCGEFSARIARAGEGWREGVSKAWIGLFEFLTQSSSGPGLTSGEARDLARDLAASGPAAMKSFSAAYEYALDTEGLSLTRDQSIELAKSLVSMSGTDGIKNELQRILPEKSKVRSDR